MVSQSVGGYKSGRVWRVKYAETKGHKDVCYYVMIKQPIGK